VNGPLSHLVDTHAHLEMGQFDADRGEVINRALAAGVERIIAIGTGKPGENSVERTLLLAEQYDCVLAGLGVHPHDARHLDEAYWSRIEAWLGHPRVVLWGEIGLDYYYDNSPREIQREVFARQLRGARERRIPIAIHCRDAWPDMMAILEREWRGDTPGGMLHSFTGSRKEALRCADLGFLVSFSGIVTFKSASGLRDAARALPPECILIETDSPYLAPVPHRGRRNEPSFVAEIARSLAATRRMEVEDLARTTSANARRLLGSRLGPLV